VEETAVSSKEVLNEIGKLTVQMHELTRTIGEKKELTMKDRLEEEESEEFVRDPASPTNESNTKQRKKKNSSSSSSSSEDDDKDGFRDESRKKKALKQYKLIEPSKEVNEIGDHELISTLMSSKNGKQFEKCLKLKNLSFTAIKRGNGEQMHTPLQILFSQSGCIPPPRGLFCM
jgi:hypothetical protein